MSLRLVVKGLECLKENMKAFLHVETVAKKTDMYIASLRSSVKRELNVYYSFMKLKHGTIRIQMQYRNYRAAQKSVAILTKTSSNVIASFRKSETEAWQFDSQMHDAYYEDSKVVQYASCILNFF